MEELNGSGMTAHDMDLYAPYDNCGEPEPKRLCRDCANLRRVEMQNVPDIWVCDIGYLLEADPDDEACSEYERM